MSNRQASVDSRRISIEREVVIRLPAFDTFVKEYSGNISTTGMFIKSDSPLTPGTRFSFEFSVADDWKLITGKGEVVWTRARSEGDDRPAGMGSRFTDLTAQSRRLIRWIVEKHIREGGSPFELDPTEAGFEQALREAEELEAPAITRPRASHSPAESYAGVGYVSAAATFREERRRRHLVLAGGAGVLLIVLVGWWLGSGSSGRQGTAPTAESPATPPPTMTESVAPEPPQPTPESIAEFVSSWASAWSDQDVDAYLSSYGTAFRPARAQSRAAWEAQRRERLTAPEYIRVAITGLQIDSVDAESATATFFQSYRSDQLSDTVRKQLRLAWAVDRWQIVDESVLP